MNLDNSNQRPRAGGQPAQFISWDKFESKFESIDLGEATFTQTSKLSAEVSSGLTPRTQTVGLSLSGEASRSLAEKLF